MTGLVRYSSFTERNVIQNPEEFFGRKNELRTIFTRLQGLQSTSIYGERKIGKSSLLFRVFQMILSELRNNYKKVYLDTLRTPGYHSYIAYITASLHSLRELCIKSKLKLTFLSIFCELPLGKQTHTDATDFLSAKRDGVFLKTEEIKLIKETSGNYRQIIIFSPK